MGTATGPNVLFIDSHDLGDWLGCYGRPYVHSPAIDSLAADGARLEQLFAAAPMCGPARIGLYLSRHPAECGIYGNAFEYLPAGNRLPMARAFAEHGYRTILSGGWKTNGNPQWAGYQSRTLHRPIEPSVIAELGEVFRDAQPFLVHVSFRHVHRPFGTEYDENLAASMPIPPVLPELPAVRRDLAALTRMVGELDAAIARILEELTAAGRAADTIVVCAADHGIATARHKHTLFDGGIRTACLIRGPGIRPAVLPALLSAIDVVPTLADLCGLTVPHGSWAGSSFAGLLQGTPGAWAGHDAIFSAMTFGQRSGKQYYTPTRAVRTRTHKLIRGFDEQPYYLDSGFVGRLRTHEERDAIARWPGFGRPTPPVALFDLEQDPWEQRNLVDDSCFVDVQARLEDVLDAHLEQTGDDVRFGPVATRKQSPVVQPWVRPEGSDEFELHFDFFSECREEAFPE